MRAQGAAIGIDIGGTKLAAGRLDAHGGIVQRARRATPADQPDRILALVAELVDELSVSAAEPVPVGVGVAGIVDHDGVVRYSPNIAWADRPLADELAELLGRAVVVDNDGNAAAWAEYRSGVATRAGAGMVMLTVGTGVGGGLVIDGRLVRGGTGLAGELGHIIVADDGPRCPCGNHGCLEALASGTAVGRYAREEVGAGHAPEESVLTRQEPGTLTGTQVTEAALDGDAFARALLARAGSWLGVGIASLVNALDPVVVVVGGGAMRGGELLLGPARQAGLERLLGRRHREIPDIVAGSLGADAGVVGAAMLALERR